jgi:uncharacterized membrane protein
MTYLLALLAAAAFGAADFLGGMGARAGDWARVALIAQTVGLVPVVSLALTSAGGISADDVLWSAAAGIGSGIGVCLLYRALATGQMGVVAPVTALCAIVLPALVSVASGHSPAVIATLGIVASLPALLLISWDSPNVALNAPATYVRGSQIGVAIIAGIGFAALYVCLKQTTPEGGLWPAAIARGVSALLTIIYVTLFQRWQNSSRFPRHALHLALAAGVLDGIANVLLLTAVRSGNLAIVAALTSLYPAPTIILAWLLLRERMNKVQKFGLCLAAFAAAAMAQSQ